MNPDQKTRLLIGSLAAAAVLAVAYGVFQALSSSPLPVPTSIPAPQAPAVVETEVPAPTAAPTLRIQVDGVAVAGSPGNKATAISNTDLASYEWTIQGGTLEGDPRGDVVAWTAGDGAEALLTCRGTDASNTTVTAVLRVVLRRPPAVSRFESSSPVITEGTSTRLSWTVENAEKVLLEPGGRDVTRFNGPGLDVKPEKTTTFTLSVTGVAGRVVTRELQIKVVPPPKISAFRAEPATGTRNAFTVTAEFTGGHAELKRGDQVLAQGDTGPLRLELTDVKEGTNLTLTVTNEAGAFVSNSLGFTTQK